MLCECCQEREANIHLTQVVDGKAKELHLCEGCAEEHGLNIQNAMSLPEMLLGMGAPSSESGGPDKRCEQCHLRQSDYKKTARLGCPACYTAFGEELAPMLAAMHKGTRHLGKVPAGAPPAEAGDRGDAATRLAALRKELEAAIRAENYEEAARVRDRILEAGG